MNNMLGDFILSLFFGILYSILLYSIFVFALLPYINSVLEKVKNEMCKIRSKSYSIDDLFNQSVYASCLKRIFDIVISAFLIFALFPIFLLSCNILKIEKKGPALRYKEIIGYKGEKIKKFYFNIYIMSWPPKKSPKMSRFGKILYQTGFYAFPCIFQVFTGKISMVGLTSINFDKSDDRHKLLYNYCKPGFVSLSKVVESDNTQVSLCDVYYLKNMNFLLDLAILIWGSLIVTRDIK